MAACCYFENCYKLVTCIIRGRYCKGITIMSLLGRGVVCATLLFTWLVLVGGVQIQRRQLNLPPGIGFRCISTFLNLVRSSAGTRTCLARLGENVAIVNGTITVELTVDQLEFACGSTECQEAFVTLIEACEVCYEYGLVHNMMYLPSTSVWCCIIRYRACDIHALSLL